MVLGASSGGELTSSTTYELSDLRLTELLDASVSPSMEWSQLLLGLNELVHVLSSQKVLNTSELLLFFL